jgi:hypothetical protein
MIVIGLVVSLYRKAISWVVSKRYECDGLHLVFHLIGFYFIIISGKNHKIAKVCSTRQLKCTYSPATWRGWGLARKPTRK